MGARFALTNFLIAVALGAGWAQGLFSWVPTIPTASVAMIGFMGLLWLAGIAFVLRGQVERVYHIANLIPIVGLVFTGIGIQIAGGAVQSITASASIAMFHGLIGSLSTMFIGVAMMAHLRALAFWTADAHV